MALRRSLPILLTALLLLAPMAVMAAQPPALAESVTSGDVVLAHWMGVDEQTVNTTAASAEAMSLWFAFDKRPFVPAADGNATTDNATGDNATGANATSPASRTFTTYINATSLDLGIDAQLVLESDTNVTGEWDVTSTSFVTPADVDINATYTFTFKSYEHTMNGTVLLAQGQGDGVLAVLGAPAPIPTPPEGIPTSYYLIGGAAAVLVLGGAGVIRLRSAREKARMNRAPRRSQALREEALERVSMKRPEEQAAVKAEIRQQEQVRERRRELQILDAKKVDVERTLELLKKRQESGGLTQHQYDVMTKKKLGDLERINAEIAEMEAEEGPGGAAA